MCIYIVYSRRRQPFVVGGPKNEKIVILFVEDHTVFVIKSYFLAISSKFFLMTFFAPQDLKRAIIFLNRATFGPRTTGWWPLVYSIIVCTAHHYYSAGVAYLPQKVGDPYYSGINMTGFCNINIILLRDTKINLIILDRQCKIENKA